MEDAPTRKSDVEIEAELVAAYNRSLKQIDSDAVLVANAKEKLARDVKESKALGKKLDAFRRAMDRARDVAKG